MGDTTIECTLEVGGSIDHSAARLATTGIATLPFLTPADLPGGGDAFLTCVGADAQASFVKLSAVQVDALSVQP